MIRPQKIHPSHKGFHYPTTQENPIHFPPHHFPSITLSSLAFTSFRDRGARGGGRRSLIVTYIYILLSNLFFFFFFFSFFSFLFLSFEKKKYRKRFGRGRTIGLFLFELGFVFLFLSYSLSVWFGCLVWIYDDLIYISHSSTCIEKEEEREKDMVVGNFLTCVNLFAGLFVCLFVCLVVYSGVVLLCCWIVDDFMAWTFVDISLGLSLKG